MEPLSVETWTDLQGSDREVGEGGHSEGRTEDKREQRLETSEGVIKEKRREGGGLRTTKSRGRTR